MNRKQEKIEVFELRKKGKSYKEISELLGVSKSTLSGWFKDINWSQEIKEQLIEKSKETSSKRLFNLNYLRQKKWNAHYMVAEKEALQEFQKLKKDKLFITGISLYWGEGDKTFKNGIVRISNTDAKMLSIFNDFLQKIGKVSIGKIKAGILLYPDLDSDECLKFWSESIKISKERFFKSTIIQGKHKTRRLGNGVCIVSVNDKYLKMKVLTWLGLFIKEF
jgi:transcriptional regulator with XRE-family HTH domain